MAITELEYNEMNVRQIKKQIEIRKRYIYTLKKKLGEHEELYNQLSEILKQKKCVEYQWKKGFGWEQAISN